MHGGGVKRDRALGKWDVMGKRKPLAIRGEVAWNLAEVMRTV